MFAAIILAGGKSRRMGRDKAFLRLHGETFVGIVAGTALQVADRIIVCVGQKSRAEFVDALPKGVEVVNDLNNLGTPLSGIITGLKLVGSGYCAVVACDMPLIKRDVLVYLQRAALGHSASVPRWPDGTVEPLLAVYNVDQALEAVSALLAEGVFEPRRIVKHLQDVVYIHVDELRRVDPKLESFININTPRDYQGLLGGNNPST